MIFGMLLMIVQAQETSSAAEVPAPAPTQTATEASPPVDTGLHLRLACVGTGEHSVTHSRSALAFTNRGTVFGALGSYTDQQNFDDQLDVDIDGNKGRVRLPRRLLPPIHGGDAGWFDIQNIKITEDAITGKVGINFAHHPDLRIDRRTASISLDGKVGSYSGRCAKADTEAKAF